VSEQALVHDVAHPIIAKAQRIWHLEEGVAIILDHEGLWHFRHECKEWTLDDQLHRLVCAPYLDEAHQIVSEDPLHVEPSLLCSDCGTHGFVRDGHWVRAG
jgi:hypothetical protein